MTDTSKKSFLVDTNLLVYLLDKSSEYNLQVYNFFEWVENNNRVLVIAQQNIVELVNTLVADYNLNFRQAVIKTKKLLDGKEFRVIFPLPTTLDRFFSLSSTKKRAFDLYLIATALDNEVDTVITNNENDFTGVEGFNALSLEEIEELIKSKD